MQFNPHFAVRNLHLIDQQYQIIYKNKPLAIGENKVTNYYNLRFSSHLQYL